MRKNKACIHSVSVQSQLHGQIARDWLSFLDVDSPKVHICAFACSGGLGFFWQIQDVVQRCQIHTKVFDACVSVCARTQRRMVWRISDEDNEDDIKNFFFAKRHRLTAETPARILSKKFAQTKKQCPSDGRRARPRHFG